jgi:maleylacetoacetate isomerase
MPLTLYTYFRSSAAYRVRIALNLKGVAANEVAIHLVKGEQKGAGYARINPNATVPTLVLGDGTAIGQSLAIVEYLDEAWPDPPLLPGSPVTRALIRAAAQVIACDTHPLNNTRVINYLKSEYGRSQDDSVLWMRHWMARGLAAFQAMLPPGGRHCFGDAVTLADLCLVPQMFNARRWGMDLAGFERLVAIETECLALPAFDRARPEIQPDAE